MNSPVFIEWTKENELGIPLIDDQHRGIVSVINSLSHFIEVKKGGYFLASAFSMMDSYTKIHFTSEESLMEQAGYPALAAHKKVHELLVRKSFSVASRSLRLHSPEIYRDFLHHWWINHINGEDRSYLSCLKANLCY